MSPLSPLFPEGCFVYFYFKQLYNIFSFFFPFLILGYANLYKKQTKKCVDIYVLHIILLSSITTE